MYPSRTQNLPCKYRLSIFALFKKWTFLWRFGNFKASHLPFCQPLVGFIDFFLSSWIFKKNFNLNFIGHVLTHHFLSCSSWIFGLHLSPSLLTLCYFNHSEEIHFNYRVIFLAPVFSYFNVRLTLISNVNDLRTHYRDFTMKIIPEKRWKTCFHIK